eukprot:CAMPEP_0175109948 /NCGR_PEP_ID=MMETSP0086_2-20121207/13728_1 /TAXON_ID=136419 /ORGANISM="Unknown Unknown, Strain D1" /LENGTH=155 /DNA_ID=CAMNT_0016387831 /DNA_START=37 /DNA_END=503 /DNA_ORIENTATION=-
MAKVGRHLGSSAQHSLSSTLRTGWMLSASLMGGLAFLRATLSMMAVRVDSAGPGFPAFLVGGAWGQGPGQLASQQLPEDNSETVDIGSAGHFVPADHLWAHVGDSAGKAVIHSLPVSRQTEITDLGSVVRVEQDVAALQVSVDDLHAVHVRHTVR